MSDFDVAIIKKLFLVVQNVLTQIWSNLRKNKKCFFIKCLFFFFPAKRPRASYLSVRKDNLSWIDSTNLSQNFQKQRLDPIPTFDVKFGAGTVLRCRGRLRGCRRYIGDGGQQCSWQQLHLRQDNVPNFGDMQKFHVQGFFEVFTANYHSRVIGIVQPFSWNYMSQSRQNLEMIQKNKYLYIFTGFSYTFYFILKCNDNFFNVILVTSLCCQWKMEGLLFIVLSEKTI